MREQKDFIVKRTINTNSDRVEVTSYSEEELIRCKKCKYWQGGYIAEDDNFVPPKCTLVNRPRQPEDFCSYAVKRLS